MNDNTNNQYGSAPIIMNMENKAAWDALTEAQQKTVLMHLTDTQASIEARMAIEVLAFTVINLSARIDDLERIIDDR